MREQPYNPNDPLFLVSRALDGELGREDQQRLDRALAESAELSREAKQLRAAHSMVTDWAKVQAGVDFEVFGATVGSYLTDEREAAKLDRVDQLVADWSEGTPDIDLASFADGVLAELAPVQRSTRWRKLVLRVGMPLAAAAAVAFAFVGNIWRTPPRVPERSSTVIVQIDRMAANSGKVSPEVVSVRFAREADPVRAAEGDQPVISFISLGSESAVARVMVDEYQPL